MRLPDGWTVGREKTEDGVRRLTLVKMPPPKVGGWHKKTAPPKPEDRVKGPPPAGARDA